MRQEKGTKVKFSIMLQHLAHNLDFAGSILQYLLQLSVGTISEGHCLGLQPIHNRGNKVSWDGEVHQERAKPWSAIYELLRSRSYAKQGHPKVTGFIGSHVIAPSGQLGKRLICSRLLALQPITEQPATKTTR
jgi:hypothetical protein